MDIVIFSASYGGGHNSAAAAIEEYLVDRYSEECTVEVIDFFERFAPSLNVLAKFAYEQSVQFFPQLYGTFFELTDRFPDSPVARELSQVGLDAAAGFLAERSPDAVISMYPIAGAVTSEAKQRMVADGADEATLPYCATVVTDYGAHAQWIHPATDDYFVATQEMKEALAAQGVPWATVHDTGIPIRARFASGPSKAEARSGHGIGDRFTVLLMGGGLGVGVVKELAGAVAELGVDVVALTGSNEKLFSQVRELGRRHRRLRAIGWTDDVPDLMRASDLLVGKAGGITVSEATAVGLPQIVVSPIPGQEVFNVDFLVNWGAALAARDVSDARAKVDFLAHHPDRLEQLAQAAERLGKPEATKHLVERVVAQARRPDDEDR